MSKKYKSLLEIHEDVPAAHYDKGIRRNIFQRFWHTKRFYEVLRVVKPVKGDMLDIGCHAGTFTKRLVEKIKPRKVYGIDISPSAISLAGRRIPHGNFQVADAANLPFKTNSFEAVICLEVLEHVDNPQKALTEFKRVLKPNGYGIILVPTDNLLFKIVWFLWTLYYPVWRHAHVQSYQKNNLELLIKKTGLKINATHTFNLGMLKIVSVKKS